MNIKRNLIVIGIVVVTLDVVADLIFNHSIMNGGIIRLAGIITLIVGIFKKNK